MNEIYSMPRHRVFHKILPFFPPRRVFKILPFLFPADLVFTPESNLRFKKVQIMNAMFDNNVIIGKKSASVDSNDGNDFSS